MDLLLLFTLSCCTVVVVFMFLVCVRECVEGETKFEKEYILVYYVLLKVLLSKDKMVSIT